MAGDRAFSQKANTRKSQRGARLRQSSFGSVSTTNERQSYGSRDRPAAPALDRNRGGRLLQRLCATCVAARATIVKTVTDCTDGQSRRGSLRELMLNAVDGEEIDIPCSTITLTDSDIGPSRNLSNPNQDRI
ncbi:MAG TPA: hypothetical protein VF132_14960 [Rudaea sp.]